MTAYTVFTAAVVISLMVAALSKLVLLRRPHYDHRLLDGGRNVALYAASKLSPMLAFAFALAADASSVRATGNAALGVIGLAIVASLSAWTVYARITGRFYGWAYLLHTR